MNWLVDADVRPPELVPGVEASGGEESIIDVQGQKYRVHKFLTDGGLSVTQGGEAEILIVGNGGPGGFIAMQGPEDFSDMAPHRVAMGGGGGGGVVEARVRLTSNSFYGSFNLGPPSDVFFTGFDQPYILFLTSSPFFTGPGIDLFAQIGGNGSFAGYSIPSDSFFAGNTNTGNPVGSSGASTGGGGSVFSDGVSGPVSFAVEPSLRNLIGQGNVGAGESDPAAPNVDPVYFTNSFSGGGGGGAGPGVLGGVSVAPNGGAGYISSITGQPVLYGGGGGGGSVTDQRGIGQGGGGNGATPTEPAQDGEDGTGGGGGGCASLETGRVDINTMAQRLIGGRGGTGVVIVRYPIGG